MPVVPRYDEPTIGIDRGPIPQQGFADNALGPEAFGAGIAKGLQSLSGDMQSIALDEKRKSDESAIFGVKYELAKKKNALLIDGLSKTGIDAAGDKTIDESGNEIVIRPARDIAMDEYDKHALNLRTTLTPEQQIVFDKISASERLDMDGQLLKHTVAERDKLYNERIDNYTQTLVDKVSMEMDPDKFADGLQELQTMAQRRWGSQSEEKYSVERDKLWSLVSAKQVQNMMHSDPSTALKTLKEYKEDGYITDSDLVARLENQLQHVDAKQFGLGWVSNQVDAGKSLTNLYDDALKDTAIKDNPVRLQAVREEISHRLTIKGQQDHATATKAQSDLFANYVFPAIQNGTYVSVTDVMGTESYKNLSASNPGAADSLVDKIKKDNADRAVDNALNYIDALPSSTRSNLTYEQVPKDIRAALHIYAPEKEHALVKEFDAEKQRRKAERERSTNEQLMNYVALLSSPQSLKSADLDALFTQGAIGKDHYVKLATEKVELSNKKSDITILSTPEVIKNTLVTYGITEKASQKDYNTIFSDLTDFAKAYKFKFGEEPEQKDYTAQVKKIIETKVAERGRVYGENQTPIYKLDPERVVIPSGTKKEIERRFKLRGVTPTTKQIGEAYIKFLEVGN